VDIHRAQLQTWEMSFERFTDSFVANEVGSVYGRYLTSYATEHHLVEVHLFDRNGELVVYITKSPGVSVAAAQLAASEAVRQHTGGSSTKTEVVYDGYSLGRSGSL
jgi:hypothetical protein